MYIDHIYLRYYELDTLFSPTKQTSSFSSIVVFYLLGLFS